MKPTPLLASAALLLFQLYSVASAVAPEGVTSQLGERDVIIDVYPVEGRKITMHERLDRRRLMHPVYTQIPDWIYQQDLPIRAAHLVYGDSDLTCSFLRVGGQYSRKFGHTRNPVRFQEQQEGVHSLLCSFLEGSNRSG